MHGALTRWVYFRLLGATALVASVAFWAQMPGLVGQRGLWPAADTFAWLREHSSFWSAPSLAWLSATDPMLHALCGASVALSVLLIANLAPRAVLLGLYVVWQSLLEAGGPFLKFQWDILLAESFFWSVFYAPSGARPGLAFEQPAQSWQRLLVWFLGFKVAFCSGVVKLASGDPAWRDLTALAYHHWTQPLPNPVSYLASLWGDPIQRLLCALVFLFELVLPLAAFGPLVAKRVAGASLCALQVWVFATGNFAYFNLLSFALAIPLLDDAALRQLAPTSWALPAEPDRAPPTEARWRRNVGWALCGVLILGSTWSFVGRRSDAGFWRSLSPVFEPIDPFNLIGAYGAFAVMTKTRPEIILEGSADGAEWRAYEFPWKPGRTDRMPKQVAPWQPRLDWQMWFAALGPCQQSPWLLSLQRHLLLGTPEVLALMAHDPFPEAPPKRLRSVIYQYRYAELSAKGQWWTRTPQGPFCPEVALSAAGQLVIAGP